MRKYRFIDHTADLGIVVRGKNTKELLENACFSLFDLICRLDSIVADDFLVIEIRENDTETLAFQLVRELIYLHSAEQWLFREFEVVEFFPPGKLKLKCIGTKHWPAGVLKREIKALTYHRFCFKKLKNFLTLSMVFDV